AAKFDIALSVTPVTVPAITMTNLTDPTRTGYLAGDDWRLDVKGASSGTGVYLHLWRDNVDFGISGPYGITDSTGAWSLKGSYGAGDIGLWQIQAIIGSATSSEMSELIAAGISIA